MVQTCSAYGCKNRYHKDRAISFHKFPLARPDVCGKWVAAMRRNNFKPTKYSNICSQHFTKDCFKRECNNRVLKENAVPSLFTFNLNIKSESLEDHFPSEIHFPLSLPLTSDPVEEQQEEEVEEEEEPGRSLPDIQCDNAAVSCDHNYTAEDSARQKKRIAQLLEQLGSLKKRLKTAQQKCRRQERQLKRLKAACETPRSSRKTPAALGEGYVIVPKHIYNQCWGSCFESIALQTTNCFTVEEVELQHNYPREKASLIN
ncbi:THAP domain-containing protein 1 [Plectropomus leopardus]|uniref:THAP domain-containing protein 1 n=1 Tax=Plectropomus leopardus TaxID=160734 RepID=UPI001C4C0D6A|nr:THAP domain-containing protein 1 [Plectropomus leopardus]